MCTYTGYTYVNIVNNESDTNQSYYLCLAQFPIKEQNTQQIIVRTKM